MPGVSSNMYLLPSFILPCWNNKGADQPAHTHSLISAFAVRCLGSIIPRLAKFAVARSDACPPGMQMVTGSILMSSKTFFH